MASLDKMKSRYDLGKEKGREQKRLEGYRSRDLSEDYENGKQSVNKE